MRALEGILGLMWLFLYDVDDTNRFSSGYRFRRQRLAVLLAALAGAVVLVAYLIAKLVDWRGSPTCPHVFSKELTFLRKLPHIRNIRTAADAISVWTRGGPRGR